jgi:hypothetical protein
MMKASARLEATTNPKTGKIDPGALALYRITLLVMGVIPVMCAGTLAAMYFDPTHKFDVQGLGVGVGSVCLGFATSIAAAKLAFTSGAG